MDGGQADAVTAYVREVLGIMRRNQAFIQLVTKLPPWEQHQGLHIAANTAVTHFMEGLTAEQSAERIANKAIEGMISGMDAEELGKH